MHWELSSYTNESLPLKFWCGLYLNFETNKQAVLDPQLTVLSDTRSPFKTLKLTRLFKVSHQIFISYMTYTSQNWYLTEILWRFGENESQRSVISTSDFTKIRISMAFQAKSTYEILVDGTDNIFKQKSICNIRACM